MWGERRCRLDLYLLEVAPYANAADYEHETSRRRIDGSDCEGGRRRLSSNAVRQTSPAAIGVR